MQNPDYLVKLISLASEAAGSDYRLAQMMQTTRQNVSMWKHGKKTCPAGDQALMAHIAGLDAEAWTARAVIAQYEGTAKGELLKQALKKALQVTGVAIVSVSAHAQESISYLIRCITSKGARVRCNDRRQHDRRVTLRYMGEAPIPPSTLSPG